MKEAGVICGIYYRSPATSAYILELGIEADLP